MKILGLHGRIGAGKNHIADEITLLVGGDTSGHTRFVRQTAIADPLKEAVHLLFGIPLKDLYSQEGKAKLTDWRWEDLGTLREQFPGRTGFMLVREILQAFGTETMRNLWGANFWARLMRQTLARLRAENAWNLIIVTDIRYVEEADVVRQAGGEVWKIIPVDMSLTKLMSAETLQAHQQHSSEHDLPKELVDATVHNSFRDFEGTRAVLKLLLGAFMDGFPWRRGRGAYENCGPSQEVEFDKDGHKFKVTPTGDCGFDTGRKKYLVKCLSCDSTLHENTTGPGNYIDRHLESKKP